MNKKQKEKFLAHIYAELSDANVVIEDITIYSHTDGQFISSCGHPLEDIKNLPVKKPYSVVLYLSKKVSEISGEYVVFKKTKRLCFDDGWLKEEHKYSAGNWEDEKRTIDDAVVENNDLDLDTKIQLSILAEGKKIRKILENVFRKN